MSGEKNTVSVRIYGSDYKIASTDPEEYIQIVSHHVDKLMTSLANQDKRLSTTLLAVLAAVNAMDECLKAKDKLELTQRENKALIEAAEKARKERDELKKTNNELVAQIQSLRIELAKLETQLRGKH